VDEATKLKPEKLLEKQWHRERAEMELPKLKKIEAKADKLELEFGSCNVLLSDKRDVSPYGDVHQKFVCIIIVLILYFFITNNFNTKSRIILL
jgi:hypothetical protein